MKTKLLILAAALAAILPAHSQQTVFEYPDGLTVKFNPNGTRSGINVGSHTSDPSSPNNGDAWYNSTSGIFKIRAGGQTLNLGEADLSVLNASNLTSGTVPDARFPATLPALNGSALTALNAGNFASGTIPDARFPATLPALNGSALTALNASNLASGTVPDARFPATLPALNGSALTALNASNLGSGTVPAARFPALTGDVTTSAGAVATTLATVNANVGSFGSSTAIPTFTVNGKGLITAAGTAAVIAPAGTLTGTTLAANVTGSSLTSVGTLGTLRVTGDPRFDSGLIMLRSVNTPASNYVNLNFGGTSGEKTIDIPDEDGTLSTREWVLGQGYGDANNDEVLQVANNLSDVAVPATARANLGLVIGTDVQAFDADLTDLADGSLTGSKVGSGIAGGNLSDATVTGAKLAGDAYPGASGILNAQTGTTYTLLSGDNGRVIKCTNASAITVTVPSGLPVGFSCQVIQGGAGTVTFSASGTTVNSFGSLLTTAGQYAAASIISDTTNTFILSGNLQ